MIEDQQAPNPDALDPQYVLTEAYGGSVKLEYIDTRTNQLANDLSHNLLASFLSKVLTAFRIHVPTPFPAPLADLLLDTTAVSENSICVARGSRMAR